MKFSRFKKIIFFFLLPLTLVVLCSGTVAKATNVTPDTEPELGVDENTGVTPDGGITVGLTLDTNSEETKLSGTLQILLVITIISIAPSILVMLTSFTRIVIVLHFVRQAVGTQSSPPNNVLVGLSLFLTFFIMSPVFVQINDNALKPLNQGTISQQEAIDKTIEPLKQFMLNQTRQDDLRLFMDMANLESVEQAMELPITVVIPAFIISEIRAAFIIGFVIYIPFIVIDMVVSSVLMSMGMMMLPPTTISMPFKILLFILADGWNLVVGEVVKSFNL